MAFGGDPTFLSPFSQAPESNFGQITATNGKPRQIQFALKILFRDFLGCRNFPSKFSHTEISCKPRATYSLSAATSAQFGKRQGGARRWHAGRVSAESICSWCHSVWLLPVFGQRPRPHLVQNLEGLPALPDARLEWVVGFGCCGIYWKPERLGRTGARARDELLRGADAAGQYGQKYDKFLSIVRARFQDKSTVCVTPILIHADMSHEKNRNGEVPQDYRNVMQKVEGLRKYTGRCWPDGRSAQRRILVSNRPSTGLQVACIRNKSGNGDAKRTCTELGIAAGNFIDSSLSTASGTVNSIMRIRPRPVLVGSRRWWQRGSRSLGRAMAASGRMRLSIVWGGIEMYIASHPGNTLGFRRTITVAEDNR